MEPEFREGNLNFKGERYVKIIQKILSIFFWMKFKILYFELYDLYRADLHPKIRQLVHRNTSRGVGMLPPILFSMTMAFYCLYWCNSDERLFKRRLTARIDQTLDKIDDLEAKKELKTSQLMNLQSQTNSQS